MRVDRARRSIVASPERIFLAFTDPDEFVRWLPPEGMSARLDEFDPEAGYRMVLIYDEPPENGGKASADTDVSIVRRVEVDPPRRIVEQADFPSDDPAFTGTMTLAWTLEPAGAATVVTVEATGVPDGIPRDVHVGALNSTLEQLARLTE